MAFAIFDAKSIQLECKWSHDKKLWVKTQDTIPFHGVAREGLYRGGEPVRGSSHCWRNAPNPSLSNVAHEGLRLLTKSQHVFLTEPDYMVIVQTRFGIYDRNVQPMFGIFMLSNRSSMEKPFTGDVVLARVRNEVEPLVTP